MKRLIVPLLLCAGQLHAQNIRGKVTAASGTPIPDVSIRVIGAIPNVGENETSPVKPPGIGATTASDGEGAFVIENLHRRFKYTLVVVAENFSSRVIEDVRPAASSPRLIKLTPRSTDIEAGKAITGRVLDEDGKTIADAVLVVVAEIYGDDRYSWIDDQSCDVTGDDGQFKLAGETADCQHIVHVRAATYAPVAVGVRSGASGDIHLDKGTTVSGRLVKDDTALAGVTIALIPEDREVLHFWGAMSAGTDAEGRFIFEHVPANDKISIFAPMQSLGSRGATPPLGVQTGEVGTSIDAGDLLVRPAVTINGRIVVPEGTKLLAGATVYVSSEESEDSASYPINREGSFTVHGLLPGIARLNVVADGLQMSSENASYFHPYRSLLGRVDEDVNLKVKLVPHDSKPQPADHGPGAEVKLFESRLLEGVSNDHDP